MHNISEHNRGIIAVFLTAILWSSGGLFIKLISLDSMELSFFRCAIAAIVFAVMFRKKILKLNPLALLNSLAYAAVLILFVFATKTTTAANAIFLQSTQNQLNSQMKTSMAHREEKLKSCRINIHKI